MLELFAKATDAGAMLWQSLDGRERLLVLTAGCYIVALFIGSAYRQERRRRDDELRERFRLELSALPETTRKGADNGTAA
jgi:hypothetical protein